MMVVVLLQSLPFSPNLFCSTSLWRRAGRVDEGDTVSMGIGKVTEWISATVQRRYF